MQKFSSGSLIHVAEGTLKAIEIRKYPNRERERELVPRREKQKLLLRERERLALSLHHFF